MEILVAALVAAVLAWAGPRVVAALPEPEEPDDDKPLYATIARARGLAPGLALAAAALAAVVGWRVDWALLPLWIVFVVVGVWLSYVDARTRLLPFVLTAPLHLLCLVLVGLAALLAQDWHLAVRAVVANVLVFIVFWLVWALGRRFGGGAFGYGDVRLAAICGLVLGAIGAQEAVVGTYAGFVLGAVGGVALSLARLVDPKAFAFGPYLVLGSVVAVAVAPLF